MSSTETSSFNTFSSNDLVVVLSYGQSLSIGSGTYGQAITTSAEYAGTVYGLNNGSFGDLTAPQNESPLLGMMNRIAYNFEQNDMVTPKLLGLSAGVAGAGLQELYIDHDNQANSVAHGLSQTQNQGIFYVENVQGRPDIYMNDNGSALSLSIGSNSYLHDGVYFEGVLNQLTQTKLAADAQGLEVHDELFFTFIHGQSNNNGLVGTQEYDLALENLVHKIDAAADAIFGKDIDIVTTLSQTRGYGSKPIAYEQMDFIANTSNSYLGGLEFQYQAENPAAIDYTTGIATGTDTTHLNALGYNIFGQDLGNTVFGAITKTLHEDDFIKIDTVTTTTPNTLVVTFSGIKGELVHDPDIFDDFIGGAPAHFGFYLYHENGSHYIPGVQQAPRIVQSQITGDNEVTLVLDRALDQVYNLTIGRNQTKEDGANSAYGGTTLRDSATQSTNNFHNTDQLEGSLIKTFIPTQNAWVDQNGLVRTQFPDQTDDGTNSDDTWQATTMHEVFDGGSGTDTVDFSGGLAVQIDLLHNHASGGHAEGDVLHSIENIIGSNISSERDRIWGDDNSNHIQGMSGNDILEGGAGADIIDGGAGWDYSRYTRSSEGVNINLTTGINTGGDAEGDILINIEAIVGSHHDDVIVGNNRWDYIRGEGGNDTLSGGVGSDKLFGGSGSDTADYSDGLAVNIDLLNNHVSGGHAEGDSLYSIENIIGSNSSSSSHRDRIWGDDNSNHIQGMNGNDILEGGAGADIIDGGAGWDYSRYTRSSEGVNINLKTNINTGGDAEGDLLLNIEAIVGSHHDDVIIGGDRNDYIRGENGDDILNGGAGIDSLFGGNGADIFMFDAISAFGRPDKIFDFDVAENDRIDIADLLTGYDPVSDAISDFVQITNNGSNSILAVDADGSADSFVTITTLYGVTGLSDVEALEASGHLIGS